jgi:hypothetical protein
VGEKKPKQKRSFLKRLRQSCESFANKAKYSVVGCSYCLRRPKYAAAFILSFLFFLYFLTFFKDGNGYWQLIWSGLPFGRKLDVLKSALFAVPGNFSSLYGISIIFLSLLQAIAIMLIIFTWRNCKRDAALDGASAGGIASVLGFATLGCPTCGISFLTPILSAIAGASASVLAERIGTVLSVLAFALLLYAIVKLGYTVYIIVGTSKNKEEK